LKRCYDGNSDNAPKHIHEMNIYFKKTFILVHMNKFLLSIILSLSLVLGLSCQNITNEKTSLDSNASDTISQLNIEMVFVEGTISKQIQTKKPVDDFHIGKYEVTQKQWSLVMGTTPSTNQGCDSCPVESVTCEQVAEFIKKLKKNSLKYPASIVKGKAHKYTYYKKAK